MFTREYGRLTLVAKGCRRKKSAVRGVILPFKPVLLSWTGKGQLPILTGAEQTRHWPELTGISLFCGYYVNELILKLLHRHDPHDRLFDCYHETVLMLAKNGVTNTVLRIFEKNLLKEIGFGLVLDRDVETGKIIEPHHQYRYIPDRGPVKILGDHQDGLVIQGSTLCAIEQNTIQSGTASVESRKLIRALIEIQLNGKTLRSRRILNEVTRYRHQIP